MEQVNAPGYHISKEKIAQGAVLESTELLDLFDECMDWQRCLMLGFFSQKVARIVAENYTDSAKQRYQYISQHISATLGQGEVALLFMGEGHALQFPPDIDVFNIIPPALDEIHRWLRDRQQAAKEGKADETEKS